jgi:hypothetical protein
LAGISIGTNPALPGGTTPTPTSRTGAGGIVEAYCLDSHLALGLGGRHPDGERLSDAHREPDAIPVAVPEPAGPPDQRGARRDENDEARRRLFVLLIVRLTWSSNRLLLDERRSIRGRSALRRS